MDLKHFFSRFVISLLVILLTSSILLPMRYNMPYPAPLAPKFDAQIKSQQRMEIEALKPEVVLIGDSTLKEGVDAELLSAESGHVSYNAAIPGSGTAAWYLFMKNVVLEADHKPSHIVILFRITMLTIPQYRTFGKYFYLLDDYARENESVVAETAFISLMNPFEKFATQYVPAYSARVEIREDLDNALRYLIPSVLTGCNRSCTDDAVGSIFGREVDPTALNLVQEDAAKTLYDPAEMNFDRQLDTSLLPHMINLARQNGVTLIFVRTRVYGPEPPALRQYTEDLDEYLAAQEGVILLDYASDPVITQDYYADTLHMNAYGRYEFTKLLAAKLKALLQK